ncbi:serine/threonine protein kinase [Deinococcus yunweiensis]|uniref:serine/threonine protein kinase n=1 Tax=Deinococcus yunweiensis TaxID=367282 RepID=UPI00398F8CFA
MDTAPPADSDIAGLAADPQNPPTPVPALPWASRWEVIGDLEKAAEGGQGHVVQVRDRTTGEPGALKQLLDKNLNVSERRFRMKHEVDALSLLNTQGVTGVPLLLDHNMQDWETPGAPLFVVMEWIGGQTLAQLVNRRRFTMDQALAATRTLLDTLERCHGLLMYHRDVKPDNVVFRGTTADAAPVLVDFGMAWTEREDAADFKTGAGTDLGNRFLRVPEHVGGLHRSVQAGPYSDYTMLVGLLLYMLTGYTPRALVDAEGRLPHHRPAVTQVLDAALGTDARAPRLQSLFTVGFQQRVDRRFQTAAALREHLDTLEPTPVSNELEAEIQRLRAEFESEEGKNDLRIEGTLQVAGQEARRVYEELVAGLGGQGLAMMTSNCGANVRAVDGVPAAQVYAFLVRRDTAEPFASFSMWIRATEGRFNVTVEYDEFPIDAVYTGPDVDDASLIAAVRAHMPKVLERQLAIYGRKVRAMRAPPAPPQP